MGGGKRYGRDQPKAAAVDIVTDTRAAVAVAGGIGAMDDAPDVCQLVRRVAFKVADGADPPPVGAPVVLRVGVGSALRIYLAVGDPVGPVTNSSKLLLIDCMRRGYAMKGKIESVDADRSSGVALLRGNQL
ncbi:hypothetical protein [Baekduia sp. Peel2402]|uniref:hypothetical protein n=1 Tax=Baekduia sp. Peel2402 TaxID=3458296 RepID=UPI00403ECB6D